MRLASTAFYMLLSFLGLSVISLGSLIAVQYMRGKVTGQELHDILRVIGGNSRIIMPGSDYDDYKEYVVDKDAARRELEMNRGIPTSRVPPQMRDQESRNALEEELKVLNRLLDNEKRSVESLRDEVEGQKQQVTTLLQALDNEKQKNAIVERDENTAKLQKTLSEMDAGDVGTFLTNIIRDPSQGGPVEAARIMRDHLKADYSAEVLGEMPPPERQRVMPLLENRFAGVPAEAVVKIFDDNKMSAGEILVYLQQMTPSQALGVYLRLPAPVQEQISPQVLRGL